jgi:hypothetical protein
MNMAIVMSEQSCFGQYQEIEKGRLMSENASIPDFCGSEVR